MHKCWEARLACQYFHLSVLEPFRGQHMAPKWLQSCEVTKLTRKSYLSAFIIFTTYYSPSMGRNNQDWGWKVEWHASEKGCQPRSHEFPVISHLAGNGAIWARKPKWPQVEKIKIVILSRLIYILDGFEMAIAGYVTHLHQKLKWQASEQV